ncbi:BirA family transcriptional regulator, biotin operon repressor / biotin-[acetyl-CoA-carboxylase] ligase [Mariniphaga anaerophila]|uniref:BirA family transcriptional regulator, biotin operon repressor / biotin-[acetyl-CoA-carboxylase] ligase n=1 Tax=Mariniphaga anaerophila TaxID=1484053 RepID=A0A1M5E204_9BACT|nr:biotin--[acetyl-CoA-carboxylase] ligase [Mariniphaga anaerophila]SHF73235.1 BirA family transcriptional regulator, biotin operon repressor / biotin-[acetyl-CoA-carboxylase] ligase [Mariniphaga anaerophila]
MQAENQNFVVLSETDSTNNYANSLITAGKAVEGAVVLSQYQTRGRGQRGNYWESDRGMNMLSSIILFPKFLPPCKQFYLSKIVSLALFNWLDPKVSGVSVKWPNDIYVGKRKIAGILIETTIQGNFFHSAVAGIGLNLNQTVFSKELPNPVSLKELTGLDYNPETAVVEIRNILMGWYEKLQAGLVSEIDAQYLQHLFRRNEWSQYAKDGKLLEARIAGIGEFGQLILKDRSENYSEHLFKEIEFVL